MIHFLAQDFFFELSRRCKSTGSLLAKKTWITIKNYQITSIAVLPKQSVEF